MGPTGCPEKSVRNYHCTLRNIPEERRSFHHVCPSVRLFAWNKSAPTGRILIKFDIWEFLKSEIQVSLTSDENNG
jgi:hypothetical protein